MEAERLSNKQFLKEVLALAEKGERFKPGAWYNKQGDCIECLFAPDMFYAERVDDLLTVYYSRQTGKLIGCVLKGVSGFYKKVVQQLPGFALEIRDGRVRIGLLLRARVWPEARRDKSVPLKIYEKVIEQADETQAEAELCFS